MYGPDILGGQKKLLDSPRTRATDTYYMLRGYWELNPGPLEEQPMSQFIFEYLMALLYLP